MISTMSERAKKLGLCAITNVVIAILMAILAMIPAPVALIFGLLGVLSTGLSIFFAIWFIRMLLIDWEVIKESRY